MAELNSAPESSGKKRRAKRVPLRIDLTAMVDLAFLLITFFMLTTSLAKPRVMPVVMPDRDAPPGGEPESRTLTLCLGKNNTILYYMGMAERPREAPAVTGYGDGIKKALAESLNKIPAGKEKSLIVIIKPAEHSNYANLVEVFDELNNQKVPAYAIAAISPKDVDLLKAKGIY